MLIGALLLSSCTTNRFYTPNTMLVPTLSDAGQATVRAGVSKDSDNSAFEAQAIYSPLPHLGIMASHFNLNFSGSHQPTSFSFPPSPVAEFFDYDGKSRFTEAGVGTYYQIGKQKEFLLSAFAGYGQGKTENQYSRPTDSQGIETFDSQWEYQRWFFQPGLSMQYRRFEVGTGIRFSWLNYFNGSINSRVGFGETERVELLDNTQPIFLTEVAWSFGWRLRPMVISLNSTAVVRGKSSLRSLDLASNYVSLTVGLNIHELGKK